MTRPIWLGGKLRQYKKVFDDSFTGKCLPNHNMQYTDHFSRVLNLTQHFSYQSTLLRHSTSSISILHTPHLLHSTFDTSEGQGLRTHYNIPVLEILFLAQESHTWTQITLNSSLTTTCGTRGFFDIYRIPIIYLITFSHLRLEQAFIIFCIYTFIFLNLYNVYQKACQSCTTIHILKFTFLIFLGRSGEEYPYKGYAWTTSLTPFSDYYSNGRILMETISESAFPFVLHVLTFVSNFMCPYTPGISFVDLIIEQVPSGLYTAKLRVSWM